MGLTISEMVIAARMNGMSYGQYVQALSSGRAKLPHIKEIRAQLVQPKKRGARHSEPVICYDMQGDFLGSYENAASAAEHLGVNVHTIRAACNGSMKSAYGYQWRYADDEAPGAYKRGRPKSPVLAEKVTLECQRCGKWYKGVKRSKYCSDACAQAAQRDQMKAVNERRKKQPTERVCPYCGKKFIATGKRLYCSHECQERYNSRMQNAKKKAQNRKASA